MQNDRNLSKRTFSIPSLLGGHIPASSGAKATVQKERAPTTVGQGSYSVGFQLQVPGKQGQSNRHVMVKRLQVLNLRVAGRIQTGEA